MKFSYNFLKNYISKEVPSPKDLGELLIAHSFEIEEIEEVGTDVIFDIDILPNRAADCFSHIGIARECSVLAGKKLILPKVNFNENEKNKTKNSLKLDIREKELCSRYTSRIIRNVKIEESPKWIKEKLTSCGLNSINNVVDILNYVMLETGQPMHAFDFNKIEGKENSKEIIVRFAKDGEKIRTLDQEEYVLDNQNLVISDSKNVLAIAGIKGGEKAKIDSETNIIVLESANFESKSIRNTSRRLGLRTDASIRFEHQIDLNITEKAINRATSLILEIAGWKVDMGIVDYYPKKNSIIKVKLNLNKVENVLGLKIKKNEVIRILTGLEFKVLSDPNNLDILNVEVPSFRLDILIEEDLIEEIGRIYGYQKIESKLPMAVMNPPIRNIEIFWERKIKDALKESGLTEIYSYSFIGDKEKEIFVYGEKYLVELQNPLSSEYKYLRPSLIPGVLKAIQKNQNNFKDIEIFEFGKIFKNVSKQVDEKKMITGAFTTNGMEPFYEAKGVVSFLLESLGISDLWFDDYKVTPENSKKNIWHSQRTAEIKVGNIEIGFLGEISEQIIDNLKIKGRVVVFDLDFAKIVKIAEEEHFYEEVSPYPEAVRDVSIIVPKRTKVVEILNIINIAGGKLIRDIDLFDIYEGEGIEEGFKSLAFHIIYQSDQKTLKSIEVDELQKNIIKELENNPNWQVRK